MDPTAGDALGIYISIPFCRSKCTYCNFASGVYPAADHARYVTRLIEDLSQAGKWAKSLGAELPRRVDTVYLGGGTPSLLEPELLQQLFAALRNEFLLDRDAEITMECAPGQLADRTLEAMLACGVNRVSLGVQSFVDREAQVSARLHTRAIVERDVSRLREAGVTNLNLDLIAGLPGQTLASWDESLTALIECGTPHASVYMLEVDEDSRLGREMLTGGARYYADLVPADDAIARMYERAIERLGKAEAAQPGFTDAGQAKTSQAEAEQTKTGLAQTGLAQYEISNFSRPGFHSLHNLRYWQRRPYLGVGLDASSALYAVEESHLLRATATADLKVYLAAPQPPVPDPAGIDRLSRARQHEEAWFLGLRLNEGVEIEAVEREFGREAVAEAMEKVRSLETSGLVSTDGARVRLTARGRLISNVVFEEFLGLNAPAAMTLGQRSWGVSSNS